MNVSLGSGPSEVQFRNWGKLPGRPSELIRLALKDLQFVERSRKYKVDMKKWHEKVKRGKCSVCLTGAVMAKSLGCNPTMTVSPADFRNEWPALKALNYFRMGLVNNGLCLLIEQQLPTEFHRYITPYETDPKAFRRQMLKLAKDLEKEGY